MSKLDYKSAKYVFIRYDARTKGCKLYDQLTEKVVISRDVEFDEEASWDWNVQQEDEYYDFFPLFKEEEWVEVQEPQTLIQSPIQPPYSPYQGNSSSSVGPREKRN